MRREREKIKERKKNVFSFVPMRCYSENEKENAKRARRQWRGNRSISERKKMEENDNRTVLMVDLPFECVTSDMYECMYVSIYINIKEYIYTWMYVNIPSKSSPSLKNQYGV